MYDWKERLRHTWVHDAYRGLRHVAGIVRDHAKYRWIQIVKIHSLNLANIEKCDLSQFTYQDSEYILRCAGKEKFQQFMDVVYAKSIRELRKKEKISIAFILYDTSMWCGDRLYRYFEQIGRAHV